MDTDSDFWPRTIAVCLHPQCAYAESGKLVPVRQCPAHGVYLTLVSVVPRLIPVGVTDDVA